MKATDNIRRIDDLGRVVIPKEIRRILEISEGAPLEISIDDVGRVVLQKYDTTKNLKISIENAIAEVAENIDIEPNKRVATYNRLKVVLKILEEENHEN